MTTVADWMTKEVETIRPTDLLVDAEQRMRRGNFRCLPVVDEQGALLGILTDRDLREHKGFLQSSRVTAAMNERLVTVGPGDAIATAAKLILARKIGGLPVVDNGVLVGIITESDLLAGFLHQQEQ